MGTFTRILIAFLLALAFAGGALAANWNSGNDPTPPHTNVTWNR